MRHKDAIVIAGWVATTLVLSYVATLLSGMARANPVLVFVGCAVLVGAFGWTRRDRDVLEVAFPSFFVAYAAYLGIVIARVPTTVMMKASPSAWQLGPLVPVGALAERWPLVLLAGLPVALVLTVTIAVPISMIPKRRKLDPHAHDRFWAVVAERNARADEVRQAPPPGPGNPLP